MKEFTLLKSLTDVNSVASLLLTQEILKLMKKFTLVKSLTNVNSVVSVLEKQDT